MAGEIGGAGSVIDQVIRKLTPMSPNVTAQSIRQRNPAKLSQGGFLNQPQNNMLNRMAAQTRMKPFQNPVFGPQVGSRPSAPYLQTGQSRIPGPVGVPFGQSSNNWFDFAFRTAGGTKPPPADTGSGNGSFRDVPGGVNNWKSTMMSVQTESGVPWEVLAAIMSIESGGNNANDPGGAMGLMQIMPKYWQQLANRFGGNLQDPYTNIRTAAEILKMNYEQYGSWEKAAAAYFGGGGAFNPDGSYSNSSDSYDTTITDYVERFNDYLYTLGYGRPTPGEVGSGGSPASSHAGAALDAAMTAQGVPYVWAGQNMSGFDCSGLMMWAYAQAGIQIPRTAAEQYAGTQRITGDDLQPGDLVFFSGTTDAPGVTHVGMYIGNGQFIQAPDVGDVVKISSLYDEFWFSHIYGYGRV